MNKKSCMPISEFARLTGIRKENLRFYDQVGLLSPEFRAENNYRYYTRQQLATAFLISSLRELGVSLEAIKQYIGSRTPQSMLELFAEQDRRICAELDRLHSMREVMKLYAQMATQAIEHETDVLVLDRAAEPIFLMPKISRDLSDDDAVLMAYEYAKKHGVSMGYPLGAILTKGNAGSEKLFIKQYYFITELKANSYKAAGRYVIAYGRCRLGESDAVYQRLYEFARANNLKLSRDIYEEYPLDQLSIGGDELYCVRLEVLVK